MSLYDDVISHPWFPRRESEYLRWYPKGLVPHSGAQAGEFLNLRARADTGGDLGVDGVYIHIPFCDHLCRFCPFNKRQSDDALLTQYVDSLIQEISIYGTVVGRAHDLRYVYFGGGTPSVLSANQIERILTSLDHHLGSLRSTEITLETHPTHARRDYLATVIGAGVTRISTGAQSFNQSELTSLGAQHALEDVHKALEAADKLGIKMGVDLLYRSIGQTADNWQASLAAAISHDVIDHVSCYSLVLKSDRDQPSAVDDAKLACIAIENLAAAGFEHYASCATGGLDFARWGRTCRYELEHWRAPQSTFLGLGTGAFGFVGRYSTVNGLGLPEYMDQLGRGQLPIASARLVSNDELMRRYFVLGVKTLTVDFDAFQKQFNVSATSIFGRELKALVSLKLAEIDGNRLLLTAVGKLYTDQICEAFYTTDDRLEVHPEEPEIRRTELASRQLAQSITGASSSISGLDRLGKM